MQRRASRNRASRRPAKTDQQAIVHPPSFPATKQISSRARYVSTGNTLSLTRAMLLNHLVMNAASTTTNYRLLSAIKLNLMEIWGSTATLGQTVTASIEWTSTSGPTSVQSDTSVGTAQPCHVRSRPPPLSLASFWSTTGSNESETIAILTVPVNGVIDIQYVAVLQNGETPVATTSTNNGVAGTVYMTPLAGLTTTTFAVVSYATLV
jgi:hypothetical protein